MASITQYVEQRLKLRVNRAEVGGRPGGRSGPCWGLRSSATGTAEVGVTVAPKALKRAQDRIRRLTSRNWGVSMERRIKEINRFTVGWTAYFAFADTILPFEKLDEVAAPQAQAGALEGVEAPTNALPEPPRARYPRPRRPLMGGSQKGYWRVAGSWPLQTRPAQRLLAQDHGPERIPRPLPPLPGMLSEPPGADPHAGWCGRGRGEPGPYPIRCGGGRQPRTSRPRPRSPRTPAATARILWIVRCGAERMKAALLLRGKGRSLGARSRRFLASRRWTSCERAPGRDRGSSRSCIRETR